MKCRSIPISELKEGKTAGNKVFGQFVLQYPDFIEFDDLNRKIVTRHSREGAFRIWDIKEYKLLYVLSDSKIDEFKICDGIMLLIYQRVGALIPMKIIDVHTG